VAVKHLKENWFVIIKKDLTFKDFAGCSIGMNVTVASRFLKN